LSKDFVLFGGDVAFGEFDLAGVGLYEVVGVVQQTLLALDFGVELVDGRL
jgi:hypothetical protein